MKKLTALFLILCLLIASGCSASSKEYSQAQALMNSGDLSGAEAAFLQLGEYKDAPEKAKECRYRIAVLLMQNEDYAAAADSFSLLGTYKDAPDQANESLYLHGQALMDKSAFEEAAAVFAVLSGYKDADEKKSDCENEAKYLRACKMLEDGISAAGLEELYGAIALYRELGSYKESASLLKKSCFLAAERLSAGAALSFSDCLLSADLYREAGDYSSEVPERLRRMNRLILWVYVRENGTDTEDSEGTPCRALELLNKSSAGSNDIVTAEKLTLLAYEEQRVAMTRAQEYTSGGATYSETLCLLFDISVPEKASVLACAYTDLGVYDAYISETYQGGTNLTFLKTKANVSLISYLQQARLVSGKNTQTADYADQNSIEKILYSVPEFITVFDEELASLPFQLSAQALGIGIADADPDSEDEFFAEDMPGYTPGKGPELYVPTDEEEFKSEQPVFVICISGAPVYKGPSNTYDLVYTAPLGESMQSLAASDGWLYVRYNKREYGWIDMDRLFGKWMFETDINPALRGITPAKKYASEPSILSTTDKSNARSGPDMKADQVGSYITGAQGVLIGTTDAWYLMNFDGDYGWIHKNNFKKNVH